MRASGPCISSPMLFLLVFAAMIIWLVTGAVTPEANAAALEEAVPVSPAAIARNQPDPSTIPRLYPRLTYTWPYATGPSYGEVDNSLRRRPGVLRTQVGSFDLLAGAPDLPRELTADYRLDEQEFQYFVVMFSPEAFGDGRFRGLRDRVLSMGGTFVRPMAVAAFAARLNASAWAYLGSQDAVLALEPYHPAFKLSHSIGRIPLADPAASISDSYELEILLFPGEDAEAVSDALNRLGGELLGVSPSRIRARLHRDRLAELAAVEGIEQIFEHAPVVLFGEEVTATVQAGDFLDGALPYHNAGIKGGEGGAASTGPQVLMVLDDGISLDAGDLSHTQVDSGFDPVTPDTMPYHRKVIGYLSTSAFPPGVGDTDACDTVSGGTHGHVVSAIALGNATDVDPAYGSGFGEYSDRALDGVAPKGKLVFFDADAGVCLDPMQGTLSVGTLYGPPGSLDVAYNSYDARTFNFSWGTVGAAVYGAYATSIDSFLFDYPESMLFVAAGNQGVAAISDPATVKNAVVVGASYGPNHRGNPDQNDRWPLTSMGPALPSNRITPLLMAPGADDGSSADAQEAFSCRSSDIDQLNPVECLAEEARSGTSYATAAVSGATMLVRNYFQLGFYPDGNSRDVDNAADEVPRVSGALVKAILVASADWMNDDTYTNLPGENLEILYRFNNEQGYGRIQLSNALPLADWNDSPLGLIVADGGIPGGANTTSLSGDVSQGEVDSSEITVCDDSRELRVALAWIEDSGAFLVNDLDLELVSPSGKTYLGNYFTDDNSRNGILGPLEDCPGVDGTVGVLDAAPWSLPACVNSLPDTENTTEAIMLSPDYDGEFDGPGEEDNQIELGTWTVRVRGSVVPTTQPYAVAIAGGVCLISSVRFAEDGYTCNGEPVIMVYENDMFEDPAAGLTPQEISSRVRVQVINASDAVVDEESDFNFVLSDSGGLIFEAGPLPMVRLSTPASGNGFLEVRDGDRLKLIYEDELMGSPDPALLREATVQIDCRADVKLDAVSLYGGCEQSAGLFVGDPYMDAGESLVYRVELRSEERIDLENVDVNLRCVEIDGDSPADCTPASGNCADPDRENNPTCTSMSIPRDLERIELIESEGSSTVDFAVLMEPFIPGTPDVEMLVSLVSETGGLTEPTLLLSRHTLDQDAGAPPVPDVWDCSTSGSCATVGVQADIFQGSALMTVTVLDESPYGSSAVNDCNDDGDFGDAEDDTDCDDDGVQDVLARVFTDGEPLGELLVLNRVGVEAMFVRTFPVSSRYDVDPGVLFHHKNGVSDTPMPVRVVYEDLDDGTGARCANDTDPLKSGFVKAETLLRARGEEVIVRVAHIEDNGDGDIFPDDRETVKLNLFVTNTSSRPLQNVVLRLFTDDPTIDCVTAGEVLIDDMAAKETRLVPEPWSNLEFKVADVGRASVNEELTATFTVTVSAEDPVTGERIELTNRAQQIVFDLDLDVSGGSGPTEFFEDFSSGTFGQFTPMTLDVALATNAASAGYRCQYTAPPRFVPPATACFLGFAVPASNAFDWHIHTMTSPDGGRAYSEVNSLHFGNHVAADDTTRLSQLDAVVTTDPIALQWGGIEAPELSFKQQVSFVDGRVFPGLLDHQTLDRGVVQVQVIDALGQPGPWRTIEPHFNLYDAVPVDDYSVVSRCMFDPKKFDDVPPVVYLEGDEDDETEFFNSTGSDPFAWLGPSSSCAPGFAFGYQGSTSWLPFDSSEVGRASDGPGLQGSMGPGTWVESRFNLARYRGRQIRIRFLASTAKQGATVDHLFTDTILGETSDDGWYIDDIRVTAELATPATLSVDEKDNSALPPCDVACNDVTSVLEVYPPTLSAPGLRLVLDAGASFADRCFDGTLQYRFWIDGDGNGQGWDAADTLLRDWTDNPTLATTAAVDTSYVSEARCSSLPTCEGVSNAWVTVTGPAAGRIADDGVFVTGTPLTLAKAAAGDITLNWSASCLTGDSDYAIYEGTLGDFASHLPLLCGTGGATSSTITPSGGDIYYLVVPANELREGAYGVDSDGVERLASGEACLAQEIGVCP